MEPNKSKKERKRRKKRLRKITYINSKYINLQMNLDKNLLKKKNTVHVS